MWKDNLVFSKRKTYSFFVQVLAFTKNLTGHFKVVLLLRIPFVIILIYYFLLMLLHCYTLA